jgi:DNA polymerase I
MGKLFKDDVTPKKKKTILLVDGNNYLMRGFWATPPLTNHKGEPTAGIKGFFNILIADIYTLQPTHVVVAFDMGGRTNWRKKLYPEYKGNRDKTKTSEAYLAAISQIDPLKNLLKHIGIRTCGIRGHEADDLIGTLAVSFSDLGYKVIVGSKDKDFAQLVNSKVNILISESRELLDPKGIKERFGVHPKQIVDYLALLGDGADNIPGVYKCGPKTAAKLLSEHSDLTTIMKNRKTALTPKLLEEFNAVRKMFPLTKQLLTIKTDITLKTNERNARLPTFIYDEEKFVKSCKYLNLVQTEKQIRKLILGKK